MWDDGAINEVYFVDSRKKKEKIREEFRNAKLREKKRVSFS